jgi:DNA recombination protein RmuC
MHDLFSALASAGGPLWAFIAALVALAFLTTLMLTMLRDERARGETAAQVGRLADIAERLTMAQAELAGRLQQTQVGIDQRLDGLARRLGEGLLQQTERTGETLQVLHERLALIDAAQKTIAELSTRYHSQPRWRK